MPLSINCSHEESIDLAECIDNIESRGFDPKDKDSVGYSAYQLRALYNNRTFLNDIIIKELQNRCQTQNKDNSYSGQSIMLYSGNNGIALRANIWPGKDHYLMRSSGEAAFYFDTPHDHNFDFLTIGYMGPGYWSEYYEYDYEKVTGYVGEKVDLKFIEKSCLSEGKILFYRAHKDVHHQLPADSLSISLNIMHQSQVQPWYDQYHFDLDNKKITKILNHISGEILLRIAVQMVPEQGEELAHEYAKSHPSDRMRSSAWDALLSIKKNDEEQQSLIEEACRNDSMMIQKKAQALIKTIA